MRARWTNIYLDLFIKVAEYLPFPFRKKKISTKQDIISTEISYQFLRTEGSRLEVK